MKAIFNKKITFIIIGLLGIAFAVTVSGCKASEAVTSKTGAQLWGENCRRCHNAPDPNTFSAEQWKTVGMHMQTRALLTNVERDKIIAFLQQ